MMNSKLRFCFRYLLGGGVFAGIIFLSLIEPNLPLPSEAHQNRRDFEFEGVRLSQIEFTDTSWDLQSEKAVIDKKSGESLMTELDGQFYQGDQIVMELNAPSAVMNMATSVLKMKEAEAVFRLDEGPVTLNASTMVWQPEEQQFVGTGYVTVSTKAVNMVGDFFEVDLMTRKVKLSENSRAIINPSEL